MSRNGTQTLNVDYDLIGNLTSRSDVGGYTNHATRKHAVIAAGANTYAYDANGNVSTRNGAALAWASFDLPLSLNAGANASQFAYTPERSRWRQVATTGGVTETTHYVAGLLEKVSRPGQTLWKHTVATPSGLSALYVRRADGTADTYYLLRDHLGSTDQVLKAAGSTVVVAESFSAFGARRGSNWSGAPSSADLSVIAATTAEGFTGHEMLDGVGLIHMHGRVYDPTMGRFLSVDPVVRDTAASQSWNGYGYVEGRMLSLTDPSGWAACGGNNDPKGCVVVPIDPNTGLPIPPIEVVTVTASRDHFGVTSITDPFGIDLSLNQFSRLAELGVLEQPERRSDPPAPEPKMPLQPCSDASRTDNQNLNSNIAVTALGSAVVFGAFAIAVVGFPEAEALTMLALMDAVAGEPVATGFIVGLAGAAQGALFGGTAGYLFTSKQCPNSGK